MKLQKDRIFELIVGTEDDAVIIRDLQVKFKITKSSNNKDKKNDAYVEIYNLSPERRKALEQDYVQVALSVGYVDTGLKPLFSGQVVNSSTTKIDKFLTKRSNTDLVTKLSIDELYTQMNGRAIKGLVPAGKTVKDVVLYAVKDMPEVTTYNIGGEGVKRTLVDGYPISGTPRKILDDLSRAYDIEWQIDGGVLTVSDQEGAYTDNTNDVYVIGQMSGLIERPEFNSGDTKKVKKKDGKNAKGKKVKDALKMKILLNPDITAGSVIKLEFEELTGFYKVNEIVHEGDYRGNEWTSTITCIEREG